MVPPATFRELKPEHRAKLLEVAARRGEKGFSSVVAEAIELYLENTAGAGRLRRRALALRGALPKTDGERLQRDAAALREFWR